MDTKVDTLTELLKRRLFVEVEASGRHVHLTQEQAQALFGHGLTVRRELSQPGQFLANERVSLVGPKGRLEKVAVLGPCRDRAQVEVSFTDARVLGVDPPVRLSGDVDQTPGLVLEGTCGTVKLQEGVIVAKSHIHMSPEDAALQNVSDGEVVRLRVLTRRPITFEDVTVRVHQNFSTNVHLDYDEANACGYQQGDLGMILL